MLVFLYVQFAFFIAMCYYIQQLKKGDYMATLKDKLRWNIYKRKQDLLFTYGLATGLIHPYEEELLENLRHVYYGGVPASIILLCDELCNGRCYDRSLLITLGFGDDDFRLVNGDINLFKLNPKLIDRYNEAISLGYEWPHQANHSFAERTKKDGTIWVYDTTWGLVFEKNLYYRINNPKIHKINNRQATEDFCEYQDIKNANFEQDKYILPMILPTIEKIVKSSNQPYTKVLLEEIVHFKEEIDYEGLCDEIHQDMISKGIKNGLRYR